MKKRIIATIMCCIIATMTLTSCGKTDTTEVASTDSNLNKTGLPIATKPIELNFLCVKTQTSPKDIPFFKKLETDTNIKINWTELPASGIEEKVNLILAGGELPDALFGVDVKDEIVMQFGEQGTFLDLKPLIKDYAPNISRIFKARPEIEKYNNFPNGKMYSIGTIDEAAYQKAADIMWINKTWLDKLNLKMPETPEELYTVLKAFATQDPNGNSKADEIPFMFKAGSNLSEIYSMFGSFGVLDSAKHIMIKDNKVEFVPTSDGYKEGLQYFHKLLNEKLMYAESFTINQEQFRAKLKAETVTVGLFVDFLDQFATGIENEKHYVPLPPLKGKDGSRMWNSAETPGLARNRFIITNKNKYPAATMRWIDNVMDEGENTISMSFGTRGVTWDYTDETKSQWVTLKADPEVVKAETLGSQTCIAVTQELTAKRVLEGASKLKNEAYEAYKPYLYEPTYRVVRMLPENQTASATLLVDINSYVKEMRAKFIMEGVDDVQWESYKNQLKTINVDKLVNIYQQEYDLYTDKK